MDHPSLSVRRRNYWLNTIDRMSEDRRFLVKRMCPTHCHDSETTCGEVDSAVRYLGWSIEGAKRQLLRCSIAAKVEHMILQGA